MTPSNWGSMPGSYPSPSRRGTLPPMSGALRDDYAALRHGCGLADRSATGRLALAGADRQRFLNGQVTCDVKRLAPGAGAYGFFTSQPGKIPRDVAAPAHPADTPDLGLERPPARAEGD